MQMNSKKYLIIINKRLASFSSRSFIYVKESKFTIYLELYVLIGKWVVIIVILVIINLIYKSYRELMRIFYRIIKIIFENAFKIYSVMI